MQNRFGLKDFVLLVVMLAVGVSVWLAMVQRDRNWDEVLAMKAKLSDLERQLSRVETGLEALSSAAPAPASSGAPRPTGSAVPAAGTTPPRPTPAGDPDASWARPGADRKSTHLNSSHL